MLLFALALAATAFEDLDQLDAQAAVAARSMGSDAVPVDRRLRLARCPEGLQVEAADARSLAVRCPALGWRLRVPLTPVAGGVAAVASAPATRVLVRRGDPLTVTSNGGGFTVETGGIASEDGAMGASVRAKLDGGRIVAGIVTGPQQISLGRP